MDIDVFPRHELPTVFRVLRTALAVEGPLALVERRFLDAFARIARCPPQFREPEPIAAGEVVLATPLRRRRLVQLAALAVLLARPIKAESHAFLASLAAHLEVDDPAVAVIGHVMHGRHVAARVRMMRRIMGTMLREAYLGEGPMGIARLLGALFLKLRVNRDQNDRYHGLGWLPEGTLGREYWRHMKQNGFGFPGERGGIPKSVAYHDVGHVLAGNDTTPAGEILQASFQGGNRRDDGFFFALFGVLQFHQGVRITPATGPQVGYFDPEKVLRAIHRGASCRVDITHQWDYWPLMALPLEEARARCNVLA